MDRSVSTSQRLQLSFSIKWFARLLQSGIGKVWQATLRKTERTIFREELAVLQMELRKYSRHVGKYRWVEDLTDLEESEDSA